MKKFVSIVIALVMVLSMTSAFAWTLDCSVRDFAWDCETEKINCGKATVDVVPYVKVNSACNGWEYVESDCASAINTEKVYYALKLTVPADINLDWWNAAKANIVFESAGLKNVAKKATLPVVPGSVDYSEDGWELYFVNGAWIEATEDANWDISKAINAAEVEEYAKVKVCLTIKSEHSGVGTFTWNGYTVTVTKAPSAGVDYSINIKHEDYLAATDFVYIGVEAGKVSVVNSGNAAFYAKAAADFNLNACSIGTCINADSIQANFGWKDKQQDCFAWSDKGASVVNPECSVEIPKTGDVSVVAYAVMAIVAAAGTMLKK